MFNSVIVNNSVIDWILCSFLHIVCFQVVKNPSVDLKKYIYFQTGLKNVRVSKYRCLSLFWFFLLFFCFFNNMVLKHSFPPIRSHDVILWHSLPINSEYNLWLLTDLWCVSRKEKEEPRVVSYHVFSYIRFTNESFCWTDSLQWFGQNIRLRLASA